MNIALILASGLGNRMNMPGEPPKQFFVLGDKPVLMHTINCFEKHDEIDAICIVCLPTWENYVSDLVATHNCQKVQMIVPGGDTRQESIFNGLNIIKEKYSDEDIVIVHDGVRPFITSSIISENIRIVKECGTAMTGFRSTDTLITSHNSMTSESSMDRDSTFAIQTPQSYRLGYGITHYKKAIELGMNTINCCELFIQLGETVHIVNGRKTNVKLTTQDDIAYLEFLFDIFQKHDKE